MSGHDSPRRLDSVSHLFLSAAESERSRAAPAAEAALWLVVLGDCFNRAHIAAGVAGAFSELGVRCTLLEIGRGLPNVGYYFALDPSEYLAPTLDETASMRHAVGPSMRFAYAADPALLRPFEQSTESAGAAHALVAAFRFPIDDSGTSALASLAAITARFSERDGPGEDRQPDCIVLFVDTLADAAVLETIGRFGELFPETVLFTASRRGSGRSGGGEVGDLRFPVDLERSWGRRSPPSSSFFSDLATRSLQVLSLRRRKGASRAAV